MPSESRPAKGIGMNAIPVGVMDRVEVMLQWLQAGLPQDATSHWRRYLDIDRASELAALLVYLRGKVDADASMLRQMDDLTTSLQNKLAARPLSYADQAAYDARMAHLSPEPPHCTTCSCEY